MPAKAKKPTRKNKPKKKVLKKALRGAIAPVEAVPIAAPALTPEVEQEVIVDTSLEAMRNGAPPRESAGRFVAPDGFIQPGDVIPDSGPALGDLLQQPFALANGGTAWVQNVHWDVAPRGDATLRITMVTNDAGTTPIHPGDGYAVNQLGEVEPVTFRRSPSTMRYHSETRVDMEMMQNSPTTTGAMMMEELTQCISDQLTMEISSMVGQPNNEATWSRWCARQRLLTSASSGSFTVTNSSSSTNVTTAGTGGIFDYTTTGLTTAATDVWATPEWIRAEHTERLRRAVKDASWPHVQRQAETSEQRIAREEREIKAAAEREKRMVAQRKAEAEKRLFAETSKERARHLLSSMLSPEQREEFQEDDCFHLKVIDGKSGEERVYRIDQGFQGNVKLLGPDGRPIKSYCIHAKTTDDEGRRLPNEDHMLAQKLLLQTDEESFLKIANMSPVRN
ncbi:MAG: hypothetical protein ACYSSM_03255 [Planctomycetota bacterium]|jgi:hypothetical protein